MNFLGHIFLSPDDDELLAGNFIADSVKGNPYNQYPKRVADGIKLHRAIDSFTDKHDLVRQGVSRFRATQGRYAPVVIDVVYDHVLAGNWSLFHNVDLLDFTQITYEKLEGQKEVFPDFVQHFFPFMKQQNWLYNYQFEWGLTKSLEGLDRRAANTTEMRKAVAVYRTNEESFLTEFQEFIKDAQAMVKDHLES